MTYKPTLYSPKRWATADIDYVRQRYLNSTPRQIAEDLGEPIGRVRNLVYRLRGGGHKVFDGKPANANSVQIVSEAPASALSGQIGTSACAEVKNMPEAVFNMPEDLRGFVRCKPVREVARALRISPTAAWRLSKDVWPSDARSVLRAWDTYKGRNTQQQSGWFIRRVHAGGVVRHAGLEWVAPGLRARADQVLAVARVDANTLLVQTLDMPSERFTLAVER